MTKLDHQRMFDTATAFFLTGERCAPDLRFGPYGIHSVNAPRIISYALAVEIALKLMFSLMGMVGRGHRISKLFEKLPHEVRTNLVNLSGCAEEMDRYFEDWRYPYEKDFLVGESDNLRRAFIECYKEIRRIKPTLESVYEQNWGSFEPDWNLAWPELESQQVEAEICR
ncbi:HEPN domain-containing protein [Aquamicrobium sp.]|uniref:HEPN domain-containing protein n=1 Tax=Aquamicrobium sp. TaxID=1872579 RepID=UPI002585812F|nr:HEPN domain-containing protein [Aquamicrobium sp.]MCK9552297.1 hypothetical protein [Aquamicrobium sp.]